MFSKLKIVVIGDIILDEYLIVQNKDICRENCQRYIVKDKQYFLGGAANVAAVLSNYGANVTLIGGVGSDLDYQILRRLFNNFIISTDYLSINKTIPTNKKTRIIDFFDKKKCFDRYDIQEPEKYKYAYYQNGIIDAINNCDAVIVSDYNLGFLNSYKHAQQILNGLNKPLFVDQKISYTQYANALLISPNEFEFADYCKMNNISNSNHSQLFELNNKLQYSLLKLGSSGCSLVTRNKQVYASNVWSKLSSKYDVVSTVGAGDCVLATFVMSFMSGNDLNKSLHLADIAGCVNVINFGTYQPTIADIQKIEKEIENVA